MTPRRVSILGATGSIGRATLDLLTRTPERFEVVALTAQNDVSGLAQAARTVNARMAVIGNIDHYQALKEALAGTKIHVAAGPDALVSAAQEGADWVMSAIVGAAGLPPTLAALERGVTVALANKESLVCAGALMMGVAARSGAHILPVDSEHNAIHQIFDFERPERVSRLILTASGGPFRTASLAEMAHVTPEQALAHPTWCMGAKISIDSATMMNKGLELIEAYHLFGIAAEKLSALVHPQSVVHSLVEYIDGSVLAQLGAPDMRTPIAYTLAWPDRMETPSPRLDLAQIGTLTFTAPDLDRFPALKLAHWALKTGAAAPAVLNASNEVAVAAFLAGRIGFLDIAAIVEAVLAQAWTQHPTSIAAVLHIDTLARDAAQACIAQRAWRKS